MGLKGIYPHMYKLNYQPTFLLGNFLNIFLILTMHMFIAYKGIFERIILYINQQNRLMGNLKVLSRL